MSIKRCRARKTCRLAPHCRLRLVGRAWPTLAGLLTAGCGWLAAPRPRMLASLAAGAARLGGRIIGLAGGLTSLRLIDVDDDHVLGLGVEQSDAGESVLDEVRLGKAILLEQVPHPLLSLNLLSQGCHDSRIL